MGDGMNPIGNPVFPILPKQLTGRRKECSHQGERCAFCGIGEKSSIVGKLLETFFNNEQYPVALIEKVQCPSITEMIPKDKKDEAERCREQAIRVVMPDSDDDKNNRDFSEYYLYHDGKELALYHSYVLSNFYGRYDRDEQNDQNCSRKTCYEKRKNPTFYSECMQSDISHAIEVFESGEKKAYRCCKAVVAGLWEIAFPVKYNGTCIAVMIIGQIPSKTYEKEEKKLTAELQESVDEFTAWVAEGVEHRVNEYLLKLQNDLRKLIGRHPIEPAFKKVFQRLCEICDHAELYYTPENDPTRCHYLGFERNENCKFCSADKVCEQSACIKTTAKISTKEDLQNEFYIVIDDNDVYVFSAPASNDQITYYIGIILRWETPNLFSSYEGKAYKQQITEFVETLAGVLHDALMTQISNAKQEMFSELVQNFSHDLNQKIEVVNNHTIIVEHAMERESDKRCVIVEDYAKDIRNMLMQLRFLVDEARAKASFTPVRYKKQRFQPYGAFIFNMNEYYATMPSLQRRFYSPLPSDVNAEPGRYPNMYADQVMMERCISNLLSNAAKYSYKYTNIYLDCYYDPQEDPENYIIKVTSFGQPISDPERIFDYGYTISENYTRPKGKGIGLAVASEICKRHNGIIELTSNEIISQHNVSVIYRIMKEYAGRKQDFCKRFRFDENEAALFDKIEEEYRDLTRKSADEKNHVAKLKMLPAWKLLYEVSTWNRDYDTAMTRRFILAAIENPTARITFTVKIPHRSN